MRKPRLMTPGPAMVPEEVLLELACGVDACPEQEDDAQHHHDAQVKRKSSYERHGARNLPNTRR